MKILMLDISGKVTKYTFWVANAIYNGLPVNNSIMVYAPIYKYEEQVFGRYLNGMKYHHLLNLIPLKHKSSFNLFKRLIKSIEACLNYIYILFVVIIKRIDVLHSQYIPFADFIPIEYYYFKLLRLLSPNTKLVLTIHDVLPHDLKPDNKDDYCRRYSKVASVFDAYMVHTKSCEYDVVNLLKLPQQKIRIAYHPIFKSSYVEPISNTIERNGQYKMIMFGLQTPYKGTDILIDALNNLPEACKNRFEVTIAGTINQEYLRELQSKCGTINVKWYPYFLEEKDLDEKINESNIIVLPYRSISQSGVLLLSLFFKKLIITSDLPSFIESLEGYEKNWFFKTGDANDLARLLKSILDGEIDLKKQQTVIDNLNKKYSSEEFAKSTVNAYKSISNS